MTKNKQKINKAWIIAVLAVLFLISLTNIAIAKKCEWIGPTYKTLNDGGCEMKVNYGTAFSDYISVKKNTIKYNSEECLPGEEGKENITESKIYDCDGGKCKVENLGKEEGGTRKNICLEDVSVEENGEAIPPSFKRDLEITYPKIPGAEAPTPKTKLPGYIKYIFNFAIMLGGILAFVVLLFGGIRWLTSAGSPAAIGDARSWMFGGIFGLALLLMTYLILTTINPELTIFKEMKPLKPVTGIYLCKTADDCDKEGEGRIYYANSTPSIKDFDARWIKFISSPEELSSVFVYRKEQMEATETGDLIEIKNEEELLHPIPGYVLPETGPGSIFFLLNKSGIYLYKETNFCHDENENYICLEHPKYYAGSVANMDIGWDNKAQSLRFNHPQNSKYTAVLFSDIKFTGGCSMAYQKDIPDLSIASSDFSYLRPIGNNKLSSLALFQSLEEKDITGEVIFYDSEGCEGNSYTVNVKDESVEGFVGYGKLTWDRLKFEETDISLDKRIISFKINGNFKVILFTEQIYEGECRCFARPAADDPCYDSIEGSGVYNSLSKTDPNSLKVQSLMIIPAR